MNSEQHIEMFYSNLWHINIAKVIGVNTWLFQDDNAPCHRSRQFEAWKHRNQIPQLSWLPQSPDLSSFEEVWQLMKKHVEKSTLSKTLCQ
jgi:hypothetical protein